MEIGLADQYRKLTRKHRAVVQNYLDTLGLYIGQPRFLFELSEHPGMTQKQLSERLVVTKETVSIAVSRLEAGGFIVREINETDRRCKQLFLTPQGEHTVTELRKNFDAINNSMFCLLTEVEKETLQELLGAMIKGLEGETRENIF